MGKDFSYSVLSLFLHSLFFFGLCYSVMLVNMVFYEITRWWKRGESRSMRNERFMTRKLEPLARFKLHMQYFTCICFSSTSFGLSYLHNVRSAGNRGLFVYPTVNWFGHPGPTTACFIATTADLNIMIEGLKNGRSTTAKCIWVVNFLPLTDFEDIDGHFLLSCSLWKPQFKPFFSAFQTEILNFKHPVSQTRCRDPALTQ